MKLPGIKDLKLAAWIVSCCVAACSAAAGAEDAKLPTDAPKEEENAEESPKTAEEKPAEKTATEPDQATPDPPPVDDLPPPATIDDLPPTTLPNKQPPAWNMWDARPDTRPLGEPLVSDTPEVALGTETAFADPASQPFQPWLPDPLWMFGQQDVGSGATGFPMAPSGFTSISPGIQMAGRGLSRLPVGFSASGSFSSLYNSNVNQGSNSGSSSSGGTGDLSLSLGGNLSYMTKPMDWTFGGSYSGSYNQYFNDSSLSGYNQGLGFIANYSGVKFTASANLSVSSDEGSNRYYSNDYVQQTSINTGLSLHYLLSPKTSLNASLGTGFYIVDDGTYGNTGSFNMSLNALWTYSPITSLGPGIRYNFDSLDGGEARMSFAPELILNHSFSPKVSLNSRIGVEFSQFEDGGSSDPSLAGSIGLSYAPSELWGMGLSLFSGTQADASASGVFTQVHSLRLGYYHTVRQGTLTLGTLNLGVSYEIDTTETSDSAVSSSYPDRNNLSLDASFGMPLFRNSTFASIFTRYNNESGSNDNSWDSFQIGLSIGRSF